MTILSEKVTLKWCGANIKYYTDKGYIFNKLNDEFEVLIKDLHQGSNRYINVKCDYCGVEKSVRYKLYLNNYYLNKDGKYACYRCNPKMFNTLSYKYIKELVENIGKGYELLSKSYYNNNGKLKIKCNKSHIYETTYNSIKQGCKCPKCDIERWLGEKNPNYNSNLTDEEREEKRDLLKTKLWRNSVYKRDLHTCKMCGLVGGKLNAHHLNGYKYFKDERFDINNGVTLCESCHKEFHSTYGYKKNTLNQFIEWIKLKSAYA